jgi:sugar phosphate isomerase/epimerase
VSRINGKRELRVLELKLAVAVSGFDLPLDKALAAAARLGVAAVEIDARRDLQPGEISQTGLRQIRKLLDDRQLRVAAVRFRPRRGYATLDGLDARIEATKRAMQMAYSLGASLVAGHVGRLPTPDTDEWKLLVEVLNDLGRYAQKAGALLATETGLENGADLKRLLEALDAYALGVDFNPGYLARNGFSPQEAVEALGGAVLHVQLSDAVAGMPGVGRAVPLGKGSVDFPALLAALEQRDYRGYFTICDPGEGSTGRARDAHAEELGEALQFVRRL